MTTKNMANEREAHNLSAAKSIHEDRVPQRNRNASDTRAMRRPVIIAVFGDTDLNGRTTDRAKAAAAYAHAYPFSTFMPLGTNREIKRILAVLEDEGVPERRIIKTEPSTSTLQNVDRLREHIPRNTEARLIAVTHDVQAKRLRENYIRSSEFPHLEVQYDQLKETSLRRRLEHGALRYVDKIQRSINPIANAVAGLREKVKSMIERSDD